MDAPIVVIAAVESQGLVIEPGHNLYLEVQRREMIVFLKEEMAMRLTV